MQRKSRLFIFLFLILSLLLSPLRAEAVSAKVENGWNARKTVYYKNGERYTGQKRIDGNYYYFVNGIMQTGFQQVGHPKRTVYYDKKTGIRAAGFVTIRNNTYYFKKTNGKMKTGWLKKGVNRYFFDKEGHMVTGRLKRGGYYYYFNSSGVLVRMYTKELLKEMKTARKARKKTTQASELAVLSNEQLIEKIGPLFTEDQKRTGILASVSMAQFILESGYSRSGLCQKANNCFGMKENLSTNNWAGTWWNGKSTVSMLTGEEASDGSHYTIIAKFRKYSCVEDSIADHSAYLLAAKNGDVLRYKGLKGCKNYVRAVKLIAKGGYATSSDYVSSICRLIREWDLTRFDL